MKHGWLKLPDRIIRLDRVHEFWVEKVENGYVVKAAVFGSQDVVLDYFSSYDEAEEFLTTITYSLRGENPIIDVKAIREGEDEDWDIEDFFDDYDEDLPF